MEEYAGPGVLIVDDDVTLAALMCAAAKKEGLRTATAGDGQRALAMLRQGEYDLVVTDLKMPVMDGYELLDTIKTRHRQYKVMVVSSCLEDRCHFLMRGALEAFEKPFDIDAFLQKLRVLLKERRRAIRFKGRDAAAARVVCSIKDQRGNLQLGYLADISADGALVTFGNHPALGERVTLTLYRPGHDEVGKEVQGRVVRTETRGASLAAAVDFDDDRDLDLVAVLREDLEA